MKRLSECGHPERKHFAGGMCRNCYDTIYLAQPEVKARTKSYQAAYYAQPEVKARTKVYQAAYRAVYYAKPYNKAHAKAYRVAYFAQPETKARVFSRRTGCLYENVLSFYLVPENQRTCYMCQEPGPKSLDHNHILKVPRGWVHLQCNTAEGHLRKSPNPRALLLYLQKEVAK